MNAPNTKLSFCLNFFRKISKEVSKSELNDQLLLNVSLMNRVKLALLHRKQKASWSGLVFLIL